VLRYAAVVSQTATAPFAIVHEPLPLEFPRLR